MIVQIQDGLFLALLSNGGRTVCIVSSLFYASQTIHLGAVSLIPMQINGAALNMENALNDLETLHVGHVGHLGKHVTCLITLL